MKQMKQCYWCSSPYGLPSKPGLYLVFFQQRRTVLEYTIPGGWLWGDGSVMQMESQLEVTHWSEILQDPK